MAITYTLMPMPIWYFVDNFGRPLGGGKFYTYSNLDKVQFKPVFQDAGGLEAWTDPIDINLNGTAGPFYWEFDSADPDDIYYLEAYDKDGNLVWTVDNFNPGALGGGGGVVTDIFPLVNYASNNIFWRNIGVSATPIPANTVLAPSNHAGLTTPDITFFKDANTATDTISFLPFGQGNDPLIGDVTPEYYLEYSCTNTPTGETMKYVQIPLNLHIKTMENLTFSYAIWARGVSGTQTISLSFFQYTGQGGPVSPSVTTAITPLITLTNGWVLYSGQFNTPSTAGLVLGDCGDDASYLRINLPTDDACVIDLAKPVIRLGTVNPFMDFQTYDQIDSLIETPRTADYKITLNPFTLGWVPLNDGTIGSATSNANTRANIDTFQLFSLIWNRVGSLYAPMFTSGGSPVVYGASAAADFTANNQLSLTKQLGRLLASVGIPSIGNNTGTNWALGQTTGNEQTNQVAAHTHTATTTGTATISGSYDGPNPVDGNNVSFSASSIFPHTANAPLVATTTVNSTGVVNANIQNPVSYTNMFMKL